jgi:hypothetical protein
MQAHTGFERGQEKKTTTRRHTYTHRERGREEERAGRME